MAERLLEDDPDMAELLDSLLCGSSGGSASEACPWDADAPPWTPLGALAADAPPAASAPLLHGWRCINPAHGAPCVRGCAPAPAEADDACFALVGDTAGQNGVKALRALVVATPEWRDARTRLRLAADWERGALAALAPPLQACAASALRRPHLLALCRAWCFASTLWRRKPPPQAARRPRAAQALTMPSAAAAPAASLTPPVCAAAFAAWLATLAPVYDTGLLPFRDDSMLTVAVASDAELTAAHAAQFALLSRLCRHGAAALRMQATAAGRWRAAAVRGGATPAWTALPAEGLAVESLIRLADRVLYDACGPQLPPSASPAARAASAELRAAVVLCGDLDMRLLGVLEQLKAAPLADFLLALEAAATFWAEYTDAWCVQTAQCGAWAAQLSGCAPPRCHGDTRGTQQPAAPGQLLCATTAQAEAVEGLMRGLERQCAALQLTAPTS